MRSSLIFTCLLILIIGIQNTHSQVLTKLPCLDKEFVVVAHVIKDSLGNAGITETQIESVVSGINDYFGQICVSFKVCEYRYINDFRYNNIDTLKGHWTEVKQKFNAQNRINIYFVSDIIKPENAAGFAGLGQICEMQYGGIVMKKSSGVGVMAHEMGHFFGLLHTFEGSDTKDENVNGSNCETSGDLVCDTPADPFIKGDQSSNYVDPNCKFFSTLRDKNGQFYDPLVGNTMSYYSCSCGFTHGQYMRMAKTYMSNPVMW